MALDLAILYRGPLASCNYRCSYCPFAKRVESKVELAADRAALYRFVDWAEQATVRLSVFFTPWGEALIRPWYQEAFRRLTNMPHVEKVAAQTNLSCSLEWLAACNAAKVALWCTYHPSQVDEQRFLRRCGRLSELGVRHSVGSVGIIEDLPAIRSLRRSLPPDTYLWVNACKRDPDYYTSQHVQAFEDIDPLFGLNNRRYASAGRPCRTGRRVISVSGDGAVQRCHFISDSIGNLYEDDLGAMLFDRRCTAATCGCHIGSVHMDELRLHAVFQEGLLERIPSRPLWWDAAERGAALRFVDAVVTRESDFVAVSAPNHP